MPTRHIRCRGNTHVEVVYLQATKNPERPRRSVDLTHDLRIDSVIYIYELPTLGKLTPPSHLLLICKIWTVITPTL